jgi:hypothetical protein
MADDIFQPTEIPEWSAKYFFLHKAKKLTHRYMKRDMRRNALYSVVAGALSGLATGLYSGFVLGPLLVGVATVIVSYGLIWPIMFIRYYWAVQRRNPSRSRQRSDLRPRLPITVPQPLPSSDASQHKKDELKKLIDDHYKIHPQTYMPITREYVGRMQVHKERVERFLKQYFDEDSCEDFKHRGVVTLEELLARLQGVLPTTSKSTLNIICLGDVHVSFKNYLGRECSALALRFANEPLETRKVGTAENIQAQIFYYISGSDRFIRRVHEGVWAGQESSLATIRVGDTKDVILGIFEENGMTIYDNKKPPDASYISLSGWPSKTDIYVRLLDKQTGDILGTYKYFTHSKDPHSHSGKYIGESELPIESNTQSNLSEKGRLALDTKSPGAQPNVVYAETVFPHIKSNANGVFSVCYEKDESGIGSMVAQFRNDVVTGREIIPVENLHARILYINSGNRFLGREVAEGVWLEKKKSPIKLKRTNPESLILALVHSSESISVCDNKLDTNGRKLLYPFIMWGSLDAYVCLTYGKGGVFSKTFKFKLTANRVLDGPYCEYLGEVNLPVKTMDSSGVYVYREV